VTLCVRLAFGSLVVASGFLTVAHGCSSPNGATSNSVQEATIVDSGPIFEANTSDAPHCVIPSKPAGVPDGWELYTDYDPCCLLYAPTAPQYLPPPLHWTSCSSLWTGDGGVDGGVCKIIDQAGAGSPEFGASVHNGVVSLLTNELVGTVYAYVIAEADGPVHQAMMQVSGSCAPSPRDMRDGKYVYAMYNVDNFNGGGFLAGDVDEFRPSFVHHFNDAITHGVVVGQLGVVDVDETDTLNLYAWDRTSKIVSSPQDVGLAKSFPVFASNALFWSASAGPYNRVADYTEASGANDLISFGADSTHGADDFGSDGLNMVWLQGVGHTGDPLGIAFDSAAVMTAPFATNPANVVARRVRSEDPKGFGVSPIKVGCGYAVRSNGNYLRILRLADGISWVLNNGPSWRWVNPLAVTCNEIFATVATGGPQMTNIARVQISSLGPGISAD